jgi:hypothetical protein
MILPFKIDISSLTVVDDLRRRDRSIMEYPIIFGIYKITSPKGAIYIGLSTDIYYRFYHCYKTITCKKQKKIYRSLKKHGAENHTFEIIHIVVKGNLTKYEIMDELNRLEIHYVTVFNSFAGDNDKFGLNLTRGGDAMQLTDEAWERINKSKIGRTQSAETVEKRASKLRGRKAYPQAIEAAIKANTGITRSPETRQKLREANLGKIASAETKAKQSKSMKGKNKGKRGKRNPKSVQKGVETQKRNKEEKIKNGTYVKPIDSEETTKKKRESHLGKVAWNKGIPMPEQQRLNQTGEKNHAFGKKQTKEHISKSQATKKRNREEKLKNGWKPEKRIRNPKSTQKAKETRKRNKEEKIRNGTYVKTVVSVDTTAKRLESRKKNREEKIRNGWKPKKTEYSTEKYKKNKEEKIANGTYVKREVSLETRKKQSESRKGKKPSSETLKKRSKSMMGKNKGKKYMTKKRKNTQNNG